MSRRKVKLPVWGGGIAVETDYKTINGVFDGFEHGEILINTATMSLVTLKNLKFSEEGDEIENVDFITFLDSGRTSDAIAAAEGRASAYTDSLSANVVNTIVELSGNLVTYVGDVLGDNGGGGSNIDCTNLKISKQRYKHKYFSTYTLHFKYRCIYAKW